MFKAQVAFSGFSVDNLEIAKQFYTRILGLQLDGENMGLQIQLPGGSELFIYSKEDHTPATYTVLNFVVVDIDSAVDELTSLGVRFEQYDNMPGMQDEKGIARAPLPLT